MEHIATSKSLSMDVRAILDEAFNYLQVAMFGCEMQRSEFLSCCLGVDPMLDVMSTAV